MDSRAGGRIGPSRDEGVNAFFSPASVSERREVDVSAKRERPEGAFVRTEVPLRFARLDAELSTSRRIASLAGEESSVRLHER
jgi:hypothetical protein